MGSQPIKNRTRTFWYDYEKKRRMMTFATSRFQVQFFTKKGPDYKGFDSFKQAAEASLEHEFSKIFQGATCVAVQRNGRIKVNEAVSLIDLK